MQMCFDCDMCLNWLWEHYQWHNHQEMEHNTQVNHGTGAVSGALAVLIMYGSLSVILIVWVSQYSFKIIWAFRSMIENYLDFDVNSVFVFDIVVRFWCGKYLNRFENKHWVQNFEEGFQRVDSPIRSVHLNFHTLHIIHHFIFNEKQTILQMFTFHCYLNNNNNKNCVYLHNITARMMTMISLE